MKARHILLTLGVALLFMAMFMLRSTINTYQVTASHDLMETGVEILSFTTSNRTHTGVPDAATTTATKSALPPILSSYFHYNILHTPSARQGSSASCGYDTSVLLVFITAPGEVLARQTLRETILSTLAQFISTGYVFLTGKSSNETINKIVSEEIEIYDDIVHGEFMEHYENLTLKSIYALRWTADNCPTAQYMLKIDTDVYLNMEKFHNFVKSLSGTRATIAGVVFKNVKPIHNKKNKWHADDYYQEQYYPTYVGGPAYMISSDLLKPLYMAAMSLPFFRIEDAFITGICASKLSIPVQHKDDGTVVNNIPPKKVVTSKHLAVHSYTPEEIRDLWTRSHSKH